MGSVALGGFFFLNTHGVFRGGGSALLIHFFQFNTRLLISAGCMHFCVKCDLIRSLGGHSLQGHDGLSGLRTAVCGYRAGFFLYSCHFPPLGTFFVMDMPAPPCPVDYLLEGAQLMTCKLSDLENGSSVVLQVPLACLTGVALEQCTGLPETCLQLRVRLRFGMSVDMQRCLRLQEGFRVLALLFAHQGA